MIKILIIEDEIPARNKLKRFIGNLETDVKIIDEIDTVEKAIKFLQENQVDLIYSDIELLDGNAFEIYKEVSVSCPIIFITAYDRFYIHAFETNGIDYLLKPYSNERFKKSWDKFKMLNNSKSENQKMLNVISDFLKQNIEFKSFKKRFSILSSSGIYFLETDNISFFKASEGVVFAYDLVGKKHLMTESTLKEIMDQLDPLTFFRINRSEIIHKSYVEKMERYNKNVLAIKIKGLKDHLKTSQNNTTSFREWIEK